MCDLDLNHLMTLTFEVSFNGIEAYTGKNEEKYNTYVFDLDPMTLILKRVILLSPPRIHCN